MEKRSAELIAKGEMERGTSGCLYINRDQNTYSYLLLNELTNIELRDALENILTEDGRENALIVEEKDRNVHIFKMQRSQIMQLALSS